MRYFRKQHNFQRISCNFHHAHQCPGILWGRWSRGHSENSNMDWRKQHQVPLFPQTNEYEYEYEYEYYEYVCMYYTLICNIHHVHHIHHISLAVIFCFIGMRKHHCQYFLLASTPGRAQPDFISSIHSYKSLIR